MLSAIGTGIPLDYLFRLEDNDVTYCHAIGSAHRV